MHNWQNAAVAYAMAEAMGRSARGVARALHTFPGLAHWMELVAELGRQARQRSQGNECGRRLQGARILRYRILIAGAVAKTGGIDSLSFFFPRIVRGLSYRRCRTRLRPYLAAANVQRALCGRSRRRPGARSPMP
ncbi:MAG: hypothetical protein U1E87_01860 [Alphaproteobacteria bacterium]